MVRKESAGNRNKILPPPPPALPLAHPVFEEQEKEEKKKKIGKIKKDKEQNERGWEERRKG